MVCGAGRNFTGGNPTKRLLNFSDDADRVLATTNIFKFGQFRIQAVAPNQNYLVVEFFCCRQENYRKESFVGRKRRKENWKRFHPSHILLGLSNRFGAEYPC